MPGRWSGWNYALSWWTAPPGWPGRSCRSGRCRESWPRRSANVPTARGGSCCSSRWTRCAPTRWGRTGPGGRPAPASTNWPGRACSTAFASPRRPGPGRHTCRCSPRSTPTFTGWTSGTISASAIPSPPWPRSSRVTGSGPRRSPAGGISIPPTASSGGSSITGQPALTSPGPPGWPIAGSGAGRGWTTSSFSTPMPFTSLTTGKGATSTTASACPIPPRGVCPNRATRCCPASPTACAACTTTVCSSLTTASEPCSGG